MFIKKLDYFIFTESKRKNKKYDVYDKDFNYIVSFGDKRYQQYYDVITHYKHLNHYSKERRRLYYLRHGDAKPLSAKWFSHYYLWPMNK